MVARNLEGRVEALLGRVERTFQGLLSVAVGLEKLRGSLKYEDQKRKTKRTHGISDYDDEPKKRAYTGKTSTVRHTEFLTNREYNLHRKNLEILIFDYYKNNPQIPREGITIHDIYGVPKVPKETRHNEYALRRYLGTIRNNNSWLKRSQRTNTWAVRIGDKYDRLGKVAEEIFAKYGAVSDYDLAKRARIEESVAKKYLQIWGETRELKMKVTVERIHGHNRRVAQYGT